MSLRTRNHHLATFARQHSARPGSLLLEVIVGAALLATLLVIINQIAVRLHVQTALIDQQSIAQQTLENVLEAFCSQPWGDLESTAIDDLEIPAWAGSKLPHAAIAGAVVDIADPVAAKRITLRIGWHEAAGSDAQPLETGLLAVGPLAATPQESVPRPMTTRTLTTWVYRSVEGDR